MANKQIRDISVAIFSSLQLKMFSVSTFFLLVRLNYAPNKNYAFSNALKSQHFSQANKKKQHQSKEVVVKLINWISWDFLVIVDKVQHI